jgi:type I restriction enzyme S subunit
MTQWEPKTIGDILTLEYGKPLDKSLRTEKGLYPAYGANGIKCWSNEYYCNTPTIIVGRKGSAGELTLTEDKFWPLDVTYFVKFDDSCYDMKFIYYLLQRLNLPSLATGVKPGINRNNIYSIKVLVPKLQEQKRIVALIEQAFTNIDNARYAAQKNLGNAKEIFDSYLNKVFCEKGENWVRCELAEHIKFIDYRGKTPKKIDSGLRLITAKNVRMGYLKTEPEEFVSPDSYDEWMTRGIPKKGDVLFTTEAPLANVAQLDTNEKVVFAQRIITMQPNRDVINPSFLKYSLLSAPIQKSIRDKGTGATATGIKASLLKKIRIEYPASLVEQQLIVDKLDTIEVHTKELITVYEEKLVSLDELEKSILQKAFSGELALSKGAAA